MWLSASSLESEQQKEMTENRSAAAGWSPLQVTVCLWDSALFCLSSCSLVLLVPFMVPKELRENGWRGCGRVAPPGAQQRDLRVYSFPTPVIQGRKSYFSIWSTMAGMSRHQGLEVGDNIPLERRQQWMNAGWQSQLIEPRYFLQLRWIFPQQWMKPRQFLTGILRCSSPGWL